MVKPERKAIRAFEKAISGINGHLEKWLMFASESLTKYYGPAAIGHYSAEDIISEVMMKFIEGERAWDSEKFKDIDKIMYMNIRSFICNIARKEKKIVPDYNLKSIKDSYGNNMLELIHSTEKEDIENKIETEDLVERCADKIKDDPLSAAVLLEFSKGKTNKEVAEHLEVPVSAVENSKKRIKRKIGKMLIS